MNVLVIDNVSKRFKNKLIIDNVSMSIRKGEILGILGPSGSGKSTFIKMIIGFFKPTKGTIKIYDSKEKKIKNQIGYSMQNNALYANLTVKQNLKYFAKMYDCPRKEIKVKISTLIEKLNLKEYEKELVTNLSGGTKKRVDIACALINDPEIIVFDEPFLGLDPKLIEDILETIIISSHRITEILKICTKLIALKDKKFYDLPKNRINEVYACS
jgi:ABC-2 type transport system ATP-binding protein